MWRNPKYHPPDAPEEMETAASPAGICVAVFERKQGEELRMSVREFEGKRFIHMKIWQFDQTTRRWFPVQGRSCSIRMHEIAKFVSVLEDVMFQEEMRNGD